MSVTSVLLAFWVSLIAATLRRPFPFRRLLCPQKGENRSTAGMACLLLVVACPGIIAADQALDEYNLAVQLYRQDRWPLASESFRKFLTENPQHEKVAVARMYLGLSLIKQTDYKGAREEFRRFVKDFPENQNVPQARYRIAECSYLLNDLETARGDLEAYLKSHPRDELAERAWPYLGDVQLRLNNPAAAAAAFAEAVQRYPEGALIDDAQFGWAKALEAQKQTAAAYEKFELLAKGNGPRAAESLFQIASRDFDAGRFAAAAKNYLLLTQRFPASPLVSDSHLNAGFAYFREAEFKRAAEQFDLAATDPKRKIQALYWKALTLKSLGQFSEAITALQSLLPESRMTAFEESILFQTGMCQRLAGQTADAQATLMALVQQFPQAESADDALHFATEMALDAGQLPVVQERLALFSENYSRSGLRLYQELLSGRYELAIAARLSEKEAAAEEIANHYLKAANLFQKVLGETKLPRTRSQSRYYLALTQQFQKQHEAALVTIQPLVDEVRKDAAAAEFSDALVLQADSLIQTGKYEPAAAASQEYLQRFPQGRQQARALSLLAIAQFHRQQKTESLATWNRLTQDFTDAAVTGSTTLILAELADAREDWATSETMYQWLVNANRDKTSVIYARRGLAWAEFQLKKYSDAAKHFQQIVEEFPTHQLAPESRYYYAESLRAQGLLKEAAEAYAGTFQVLSPQTPAAAGAEQQLPLLYAYRAGLQAARTYRQSDDTVAADAAYAAVVEKFPQPQHLDKLLDEWALLNYEAERYERADEIFRKLVAETPGSDLADNARLSLAESDLLASRLEAARKAFQELKDSEKADAAVRERALYQLIVMALEERNWPQVKSLATEFQSAYPESPSLGYAHYAQLEAVLADRQLTPEQLESTLARLKTLKPDAVAGHANWASRLWVLTAEAQFRLKKYDEIAQTAADLKANVPESPLQYQLNEVWGRALKQQAKFEEARQVLEQVVSDEAAYRTETAAKSQFLIAETWFLQEQWKEAFLAYQKVYASYAFAEWQSAALLQSGKCDEQLGNFKAAQATYDRLISEFPESSHVDEARQRLMAVKLK